MRPRRWGQGGQWVGTLVIAVWAFASAAQGSGAPPHPTADPDRAPRTVVTYWEKWTGFEGDAMKAVVDAFNRSQDRIEVRFLTVSQIDRKTLLATAGGDPPDVAGLWVPQVFAYADNDALMPLDSFIEADGETPAKWIQRFEPMFAELCQYRGRLVAAPSTTTVVLLHWNKALFREAGLDPERPPQTLRELDAMAERLTVRQGNRVERMGFLIGEPGWWRWALPVYFGGRYFDLERNAVTVAGPETLAALRWVRSYPERFGLGAMQSFSSGFGNFSSPQNAFMAGQVAMVWQGVWFNNYIQQYAPGLEYGVAPLPAVGADSGELAERFTVADADTLVIPRGSKHPREAWEFIKYVASSNPEAQSYSELSGMELLCYLQQKQSPLRAWSPYFLKSHPHPSIALFRQVAQECRHHTGHPKTGLSAEFNREITTMIQRVELLLETPESAMAACQAHLARSWDREQRRVARRQNAGADAR